MNGYDAYVSDTPLTDNPFVTALTDSLTADAKAWYAEWEQADDEYTSGAADGRACRSPASSTVAYMKGWDIGHAQWVEKEEIKARPIQRGMF